MAFAEYNDFDQEHTSNHFIVLGKRFAHGP